MFNLFPLLFLNLNEISHNCLGFPLVIKISPVHLILILTLHLIQISFSPSQVRLKTQGAQRRGDWEPLLPLLPISSCGNFGTYALVGQSEGESESVSCSVVSDSVTPRTVALQAPLSMGFSRQEYWSGWPYPSPGIFQTQGSNPGLPHCRQILYHLSYLRSPSVGGWFKTKILFSFGENMLADPTAL